MSKSEPPIQTNELLPVVPRRALMGHLRGLGLYLDANPIVRRRVVIIGIAGFFALLGFGLEQWGVKLGFYLPAAVSLIALGGLAYSIS